jgi:hypothetical protein
VPIQLTISHEEQLCIAVAEGEIQLEDAQRALMRVVAEKAIPYAKLLDLTFAPLTQRAAGIRALSQRVADFNKGFTPGPLAVVVTSELAKEMVEMFDQQVQADRPMAIFTDLPAARQWIESVWPPARKP